MASSNNFSLSGIGSSVRYGKKGGILTYSQSEGFKVRTADNSANASLIIADGTDANSAATRNYVETYYTAGNGLTVLNGEFTTALQTNSGLTVGSDGLALDFSTLSNINAFAGTDTLGVGQNGTVGSITIGDLIGSIDLPPTAAVGNIIADGVNNTFTIGYALPQLSGLQTYVTKVKFVVTTPWTGNNVANAEITDGTSTLMSISEDNIAIANTYWAELPLGFISTGKQCVIKFTEADGVTAAIPTAGAGRVIVEYVLVGPSGTGAGVGGGSGSVTSITAGNGLDGGVITSAGTISLATSGVIAGTYNSVVVDTYGRVTYGTVSNVGSGSVSSIVVGSGLVAAGSGVNGTITSAGTISLGTTGVVAGSYGQSALSGILTIPTFSIGSDGRITNVSPYGYIGFFGATGDISSGTATNGTWQFTLPNLSGLTAGTYTNPTIVVNAKGQVTAASSGSSSGSVTQIIAGSGLTGGTITGTGTIALGTTGVTAGTYGQVVVDVYGRVTSGTAVSASNNTRTITQAAHGLIAGNVVRHNGTGYVTAIADNAIDAEAIGIVSSVIDSNNFVLLTDGLVTGLSGLTAGSAYFLSDGTAGALTATPPTTTGHVIKPLLVADSGTSGYFNNMRGQTIGTQISAINGGGLRNVIINGAMHIYQRTTAGVAANVTSNTPGYTCMDRFFIYQNGTVSVQASIQESGQPSGFQSVLKWGRPSGQTNTGVTGMGQVIESANSIALQNQPVTLSFYAKAGTSWTASGQLLNVALYTGGGIDQSSTSMIAGSWTSSATPISASQSLTSSWVRYSFTTTLGVISQLGVHFSWTPVGTAGADDYVYITGVQLEAGSYASPFDFRPITTELELCQRYYHQRGGETANQSFVTGGWIGSSDFWGTYYYPVKMRTAPAFSTTGAFTLFGPGTLGVVTIAEAGTESCILGCSGGSSSGTVGMAATLRANNSTATRIFFNSEF